MKINKILRVALVGVLCLAMLLCAACTPEEDSTDTTPTGEQNKVPNGEIPTEEGKVTFYFTLGDGSVTQESFASYFLTGGCTGWTTGNSGELEFKQLDDSNVYYCISDVTIDPAAEQGLEYSILVGYNTTSGMTDGLGVQWKDDRKSNECAAYPYPSNATFEWAEGQSTVNLGTHTIETKLPAPQKVSTTLVASFKEALPEGATVAMYGSMNNWGNSGVEQCICTISEDRMSASLALSDVLTGTYEFKVVVYAPGVEVNSDTQWTGTQFCNADGSNASVTIGSLDAGETIDVLDTLEYVLPSNVSVTLRVTFSEALTNGERVHIYGNFENWGYNEGKCEMTSEDNITWTITVSDLSTGELQFKVLTYAADATAFDWGDCIKKYGNNGDNFTYEITVAHNGQTVDVATITVE